MRRDESFGYMTADAFNPFGPKDPISFDFSIGSQFAQPSIRSRPRISTIRPPISLPFDGTSFNGVLAGVGIVAAAVLVYLLGKKQKWWK